jgi:ubiquinone/menaquinone biosynthesis C-methylase UbiE
MPQDYDDLVEKFGDSPLSLGWGLKDRREIRFRVLMEPWDLKDATVLDLGCGFGDLLGFMQSSGLNVNYTGFDSSYKALEIARVKNPTGRYELIDLTNLEDEDRNFDFVFASGIFNDKRSDSSDFARNVLRQTYRLAKKGFSMNFLSTSANVRYERSEYTAPSEIARICEESSMRFQINHFYMPFEFTVHVSKRQKFNVESVIYDEYFDQGT